MRVLIFHGYLLERDGVQRLQRAAGRGARAARPRRPPALPGAPPRASTPFVDAAGDWDAGALQVRELRATAVAAPGRRRAAARSTGRTSAACCPCTSPTATRASRRARSRSAATRSSARYVAANVAAVRELLELVAPELALANHLVMGPVILARALAGEVPYAVKVHGSALEYTVKPEPERFLGLAREGLAGARGVLVGSRHTAESLWTRARRATELRRAHAAGPARASTSSASPRASRPRRPARGARAGAARLRAGGARPERGDRASAFARDRARGRGGARAPGSRAATRLVAFVGKLIVSKGVDLLLAAWPLVLERVPAARLVVVGFGAYRDGLERLLAALAAGDLARRARDRARRARAGGRRGEPAAAAPPAGLPRGPRGRAARALPARPPAARRAGRCSPGAWSTRSSPSCCPRARRWSCRAPSRRPSGWSPPRPPPAARCRSARPTRASPR